MTQTVMLPLSIIPGNGAIFYEYDPIQRLIEACYPGGTHFSYTYDYNSNLRSIKGPAGVTTYTYDRLNRLENVGLPHFRYDWDCLYTM